MTKLVLFFIFILKGVTMQKLVYLDIEGTLIEDFSNPIILEKNKQMVNELISDTSQVFGFSWAVCNYNDNCKFQNTIEFIDNEFEIGFHHFVHRDNLFDMFKKIFGSGLDFNEFEDFCNSLGKEYVFQQYIRKIILNIYEDEEDIVAVLLDDRVEDTVLEMKTKNGFDIKIITIKAR